MRWPGSTSTRSPAARASAINGMRASAGLAGQRGLHDLVGVVEVQPALGLQFGQVAGVEPAAPAQVFQVVRAVGVARLDQGELRHIGGGAQRFAALEQPGAGHHGQLLAKQADAAWVAPAGMA